MEPHMFTQTVSPTVWPVPDLGQNQDYGTIGLIYSYLSAQL